jgi:hypothetical protein
MSRFSNVTAWPVAALIGLSIVFGVTVEAAAQEPRLILPSSNIRRLPSKPPAGAEALVSSPRALAQPVPAWRPNKATRAAIVALAAVGGFFGGGIAGAAIENTYAPCHCDDPGLQGALIGAPIGAIVAGVLTFRLLPGP